MCHQTEQSLDLNPALLLVQTNDVSNEVTCIIKVLHLQRLRLTDTRIYYLATLSGPIEHYSLLCQMASGHPIPLCVYT